MDLFTLGLKLESVGFDDATRQLKQVDEVGKGTANRLSVLGALQKEAAEHAGAHSLSLSRLERSFESFAARATGTNETLALLGATMGRFALGTIETAGLLAGIAGVVAIYDQMTEGARKAQEQTDKLIDSLVAQRKAAYDATIAGLGLIALRAEMEQNAARKASPMGWKSILESAITGHGMLDPSDAESAAARIEQVTAAVSQAYDNLAKAIEEAKKKSDEATQTAAKKAEEAARAADAALVKHIEILSKGIIFENTRVAVTRELTTVEAQLTRVMNDATASLDRRTQAAERLAAVQATLARKFTPAGSTTNNTDPMSLVGMVNSESPDQKYAATHQPIKLPAVQTGLIDALNQAMDAARKQIEQTAQRVKTMIVETLGQAVTQGFIAAFSGKGIGGAFKALGKTILQGLGQIFITMGEKMVEASAIMQAFQKAIMSFLPGGGLVAGLALIALGAAMSAVGGGSGASGGGGGGSAYGSYGPSRADDITKIRIIPSYGADEGAKVTPTAPYIFAPTIIGQNDPVAQRQLAEMAEKGARRGL